MVLEKLAPLKGRYNQAPFVTKKLRKAILSRSRLLNRYRKEKTVAIKSAYRKETEEFCVKLLRNRLKRNFTITSM